MEKWLRKYVTWSIIGFTTLVFILFILLILPKVSAYTAVAIGGQGSPDTEFLYTGKVLYKIAASYGAEGRRLYILIRWTFDLVWPLVYGAFLTTLLIGLTEHFSSEIIGKSYLLAIGAVFFDYLENTCLTIVMALYPRALITFGSITAYVSLIKWVLLSGAFIAVIITALTQLIRLVWEHSHQSQK